MHTLPVGNAKFYIMRFRDSFLTVAGRTDLSYCSNCPTAVFPLADPEGFQWVRLTPPPPHTHTRFKYPMK